MSAPPPRPLRIVLISPKGPLYRHRGGIFRRSLRYMPLTLPTLASLVPQEMGAEVVCLDEGIQDVDPSVPADLVGMTVITGTAPRAYALARRFRERGVAVVLGGPHVTLAPEDASPHADAIVVGYAERTWPELLRDFRAGRMRARYDQAPGLELAGLPLPDRAVLPGRRYLTSDVFEATRGCVHACEFCVVPSAWGRRPLQKPVEDVVADLRAQGARRAIFVDLNLIADRAYARELFTALVPLRIRWFGLATTLLGEDLPLLDLIAESGCRGLLMGLESIEPANLSRSRKGFNRPERYGELVEALHQRGIALQGCFVFGLDEDRPDVFERTARLAIELGVDLPRFAVVTPFPGTPLYRRLEEEGRILTRDWELYDGQHVVFQPARMSVSELQEGTERAWKVAYSWPGIVSRLRRTAAPWPIAVTTNLGYRHYARNLHRFYTCDWMIGVGCGGWLPPHRRPPPPRPSPGREALVIRPARPFRLTIVHPCVGRRAGMKRYIRTWQMMPLPAAAVAAMTPPGVEKRFYDDRLEAIPYDEPTDLVAISVETYTARRAYQIASEYRRRGVPVVMGGFHATLCPEEVGRYCESLVVGEAEDVFPRVIDDYRHGTPERVYRAQGRSSGIVTPDRSIFRGKRYLGIGLVESARGCRFRCDFCAITSVFGATQTHRDVDQRGGGDRERAPPLADDLLRGRQHHVGPRGGQRAHALARAPRYSLGQPVQHQRRVRRGSAGADAPERMPGRAGGLREPGPGRAQADAQVLQPHGRRSRAGHGELPPPRDPGLRHVHLRVRRRRARDVRDGARLRARGGALHCRLQPHHALSGHPALHAHALRGAAPLRRLVAGPPLPLQHGAVPAGSHDARGAGPRLRGGAAALLRLAQHRGAGAEAREPLGPLHAGQLHRHQLDAPTRRGRAQRSASGRRDVAGPAVGSLSGALRFELAEPADDAALRRLLEDAPMDGQVRLAFTREPGYFDAARVEGARHATLVLRGPDGRSVLAMGSRSVRDVYVDGSPARLGYLGQLRWAPGHRPGRRQLAEGYRRMWATRLGDELPFDLTSVAADNLPARRLLERGLPGVPVYTPLAELETRVLRVRTGLGWSGARGGRGAVVVRRATALDMSAMARLLDRDARSRRLAPRWSEEQLAELASGRLGRWCPVVLEEGGDVTGAAALWDQRALRQVVVHSYAPLLGRLRRWLNPLERLAGRPVLPPPGTTLPMGFVSHLSARDAGALRALLAATLQTARAEGLRYLTLALTTGDPLLPELRRRFRGRAYRSVLYLVHEPGTDRPLGRTGAGDVRVEVATL
jgi:radical SAM superfamily enzyme YgiQ (UPF0313 family)